MKIPRHYWLAAAFLLLQVATFGRAQAEDTNAYLSAVALSVKNLEEATVFYSEVFGLQVNRTYNTDTLNENIMGFASGEGASLVLVQYKNKKAEPGDKPARIVFYADDPKAIVEKGVALGATVIREPAEIPTLNTVIGIMRDLDGYPVEVIKRRN
ncbi:MAG: VOC family protein [Cellvibrionaceae bacterium]